MLDQLVESTSHTREDRTKGGLLLTTFVLLVAVLVSSWVYSLFGKELMMSEGDLALDTLVAPPIIEEAPEPEPEKPKEQQQKDPNVDIRKEIIATMDEPPPAIPDKPSVVKNTVPPRDPSKFTVKGDRNFSAENAPPPDYQGSVNTSGTGSNGTEYTKYEYPGLYTAAIQHHFLSAIVPQGDRPSVYQVKADEGRLVASVVGTPATVAPGESAQFEHILYVGPKLQDQLEPIHPKLDLTVDYGWLTLLSSPMFMLLSWIHDFVGNWGWAIIIVTVIIKLAFYKLTATSGRSMAKMRELQPRMKALQERYKDDRQALSQAMMDLYKREKVNPAAGCLPILIQMPFFLAFYWVLVESVEMRQAPFALWIDDLSVRDPYFILPLIMGAAMLFQQKLNPAPADPVQARVMQIMPIMFTGFFAFFPSGLVLYWVTNTLLSIAQQWRINKVVHAEAVARKQGKPKKGKKGKPEEANPDPP